jgi:hypothetical protein
MIASISAASSSYREVNRNGKSNLISAKHLTQTMK